MSKLYPPNIKGIIPAFYGTTLVVPFSMNRAVGINQVGKIKAKLKTISGEVVGSYETEEIDYESLTATFKIKEDSNPFVIGQFYKIQVAYLDTKDNEGYYSTIGIIKYTVEPQVFIEGMDKVEVNTHKYKYVGVYSQEKTTNEINNDPSEKLYSSRFQVWDENWKLYKDTGYCIHDTTSDIETYESKEEFSMPEDLEDERIFYIKFTIITVNLLEKSSPIYRIKQRRIIESEEDISIWGENDFVNGCIDIHLDSPDAMLSGNFVIARADSKNNYLNWSELFRIELPYSIKPSSWKGRDYSTEQGIYYKYSIQQYNNNRVYSEKFISEPVYSDFEDSFLYDGDLLLNIRFNPKVSSYKINLQEQKQDTIGSKFPRFFRNKIVGYKEFPISGLVSYMSDVDNRFMSKEDLDIEPWTTNLISENLMAERYFKNKVLNWLADGKPRLFKSPGEGNFIVRLMNTSMSPQDSLGRMLHNFSTTAYEMEEYTIENLNKLGLIGESFIPKPQRALGTFNLSDLKNHNELDKDDLQNKLYKGTMIEKDGEYYYILNTTGMKSISITDTDPKTEILINDEPFWIGSTGSYYYDGEENSPLKSLKIKEPDLGTRYKGLITYSYAQRTGGMFDKITGFTSKEIPIIQFFGDHYKTEELVDSNGKLVSGTEYNNNLYNFLQDARTSISKLYMVRFVLRDWETLYINEEEREEDKKYSDYIYYSDPRLTSPIMNIKNYFRENKIYFIRKGVKEKEGFTYEGYAYDASYDKINPILFLVDGLSKEILEYSDDIYKSKINDADINIKEVTVYNAPNTKDINYIEIGAGVTAELSYCKLEKDYNIENYEPLKTYKQRYLTLLENSLILDADLKYVYRLIDDIHTLSFEDISANNNGRVESSEYIREAYYKYMTNLAKELAAQKEAYEIL